MSIYWTTLSQLPVDPETTYKCFFFPTCVDQYIGVFDWLVGWLVGWLVDWLIDWFIDWLIVWLVDTGHRQHPHWLPVWRSSHTYIYGKYKLIEPQVNCMAE